METYRHIIQFTTIFGVLPPEKKYHDHFNIDTSLHGYFLYIFLSNFRIYQGLIA